MMNDICKAVAFVASTCVSLISLIWCVCLFVDVRIVLLYVCVVLLYVRMVLYYERLVLVYVRMVLYERIVLSCCCMCAWCCVISPSSACLAVAVRLSLSTAGIGRLADCTRKGAEGEGVYMRVSLFGVFVLCCVCVCVCVCVMRVDA